MTQPITRRRALQFLSAPCVAALPGSAVQAAPPLPARWFRGRMTGAEALVETLQAEGTDCVYGIPGAQMNEIWDTFKTKRLSYLLVTHEYSAACMADGYARSTGKPGVLCIIPGPGLTNALTGIGEALLDSIPLVCIVGDIAKGNRARAFQVHALPQAALLQPVTKQVFEVCRAGDIPQTIRHAFQLAQADEPGPVAVVIPYHLLNEADEFHSAPLEPLPVPLDQAGLHRTVHLLQDRRKQVGIYAGLGCMNHAGALARLAETLQAPVATSISGKGVIPENHPLSVGWGYGPQATRTAETAFQTVDLVLAIGVKFSEVSTGYYSQPAKPLIQVDANADNLGRVMRPQVCVHADAGVFLHLLLDQADSFCRPSNPPLVHNIRQLKCQELRLNEQIHARHGTDPMAFFLCLRRLTHPDALAFVDVTMSEFWAAEVFTSYGPRTYFNPTDNQAMGWSIPAALGAQKVFPGRQTVTVTGDGCLFMSGMEIATAARENLPVKFFILDDQTYHYMQALQRPAYLRTTATILPRLDYRALAQGWNVGYQEIIGQPDMEARIRSILDYPGPVLTRVAIDYRSRPVRWLQATKKRYTNELNFEQKMHYLTRIGSRALDPQPEND